MGCTFTFSLITAHHAPRESHFLYRHVGCWILSVDRLKTTAWNMRGLNGKKIERFPQIKKPKQSVEFTYGYSIQTHWHCFLWRNRKLVQICFFETKPVSVWYFNIHLFIFPKLTLNSCH